LKAIVKSHLTHYLFIFFVPKRVRAMRVEEMISNAIESIRV